ncbi:MAG TPA: response regulator, partial [Cellvibrionaceae bacterium]|nr:response regulator [Cellvibrionaceae bacterium]
MGIEVLVVDDSAVMRQVLREILNEAPDINVYAAAPDPIFALQKMQGQWPDVIVLDIEMPRMDGLTFLRKIMAERPTPIIICSSLAKKGTELSLQALAAGEGRQFVQVDVL